MTVSAYHDIPYFESGDIVELPGVVSNIHPLVVSGVESAGSDLETNKSLNQQSLCVIRCSPAKLTFTISSDVNNSLIKNWERSRR